MIVHDQQHTRSNMLKPNNHISKKVTNDQPIMRIEGFHTIIVMEMHSKSHKLIGKKLDWYDVSRIGNQNLDDVANQIPNKFWLAEKYYNQGK